MRACFAPTKALQNQFFQRSHQVNDNAFTLITSRAATLIQAQQSHAHILKTGLSGDTHLVNKLLSLYAHHHSFSDANLLLDSLPHPDIFSFAPLIYASSKISLFDHTLKAFSRLLAQRVAPDTYVLPSAIRACAGLAALNVGRQVHGYVFSSGFALDSFVQSALVHMYVKCNDLKDARKVFDTMPEPDVVSWSALAAGYAKEGDVVNAKEVFGQTGRLGIQPNSVSWNGLIAGFNQSGCFLEAVSVFHEMHLRGFMPDGTSISSVLPAIGDLSDLNIGIQIHAFVIKLGLKQDICIVSSLIDMYGKCNCAPEIMCVFEETDKKDLGACNAVVSGLSRTGHVDDAIRVFKQCRDEEMELNVVSWTSIIASCSQHGKDMEALELFREMQMDGVEPNRVTIPCLLPACGNIAALMHGKAAHSFSLRRGFVDDVFVSSALVDMYANCGRVDLSRLTFDKMPTRNLVSWNALLGGYAMHGKANEALGVLHSMLQNGGVKPDAITFTSVLSACSQTGLSEEGEYYFDVMTKDHGIEPRPEHYACMVSLLGRAGRLEEAHSLITKMPFKPDACVWGALLSSCKTHHSMHLGEVAANELFKLEPTNPGNYILMSNIYAYNKKFNEVDKIRKKMEDLGLRKNPGCSWIEVKNIVHMLLAGDKSHPQMRMIMEKLAELSLEMKKSGVLPNTDFVLQDVEEQEKEQILCGHSEKLAVVLGILNTGKGYPLRVIKNLRICGDCHSFMKFISMFEGREIFVRDTNRFHHFKDGVCSCMDYW
ncbi:unnamed protein product [Cuscuta epithymum]|uniref:DYW domain-containing protein n=1 Tax=Cuscuta epithymum TaxID=186058 RepID=A0AAV0FK94_9ASTE|nr:unnamed protein product [Cuscuta epithymum]